MEPVRPLPRPIVLYLDDDEANRKAFMAAFRRDFEVLLAANLDDAWKLMELHQVHVVIADQRMPVVKGSEALRRIKDRYPGVKRMLVTAFADLQAIVDALNQAGVCYYIQKPWEADQLREAVARAYREIVQEEERSSFTARLLESNRQLEFALRQRLLS